MARLHTALHFTAQPGGSVRCDLCPHNCLLRNGAAGICGVRNNEGGVLVTGIYGCVTGMAMDPIEKKPLYHFYPGSSILSIGTRGCNMKCPYCQNWHISQDSSAPATSYLPERIVELALERKSIGIAYTYSEPIIWFEYVLDAAKLARPRGLANVMVTNGYINPGPLEELLPWIDAMNIDLKTFNEGTYRRVQKGGLGDVCRTIRMSAEYGCHVELTTLLVTGVNDSMEEMKEIVAFIASVNRDIPWHISRYYPNYRYDEPATDVDFMREVYEMASGKLAHVYCGNVPAGFPGNATVCHSCGTTIVSRAGYQVKAEKLGPGGRCGGCGARLYMRS